MRHATIPSSDRDILQLNVHVILGLEKFSSIHDSGGDFQGDNVALGFVKKLDRDTDRGGQFAHCEEDWRGYRERDDKDRCR